MIAGGRGQRREDSSWFGKEKTDVEDRTPQLISEEGND